VDERHFHRLIEERRQLLPYSERRLHVDARLTTTRAEFTIADEGPGFDPNSLPDPTDPVNLDSIGGRGLLLIRTFMDEVAFNERGNRISLVKYSERGPSTDNPSAMDVLN
jgi:anti-sigma regulatory factor (Ser/Thr protein kinase)